MSPSVAVLAVGDELLSGELSDTNTAVIARHLGASGWSLREARAVPDRQEDIAGALGELARRYDCVIVTGGLGPTEDDLTAAAAAAAFGQPLALHQEALGLIREFFDSRGRQMHARNEKQALLPQRAAVFPNPTGTAPGFELVQGRCRLYFLPGVPSEMERMLAGSVLPRLREHCTAAPPLRERILKVFGLSEPRIEELLCGVELPAGCQLAFGVEYPVVLVKLRAAGAGADALLQAAEETVRGRLGEFIFATGAETLAETLAGLLSETELTLSLAESCTGGLIAAALTDVAGASAFLERGAVTYANSAKQGWLGVDEALLERHGAVSEPCARAMAEGIRRVAGTDLGLAVTGIAGPTGGTADKPVGTVFIALATADDTKVRGFRFSGERHQIRRITVHAALDWLRRTALAARGRTQAQ